MAIKLKIKKGDNVIVINSEKINLTGTKMDDKIYGKIKMPI